MNTENKVLLQLRSKDDYLYPDCWTLPGGRVEEGEILEQAIVREVKEELGWDLRGCGLFRTIVLNDSDGIMERHKRAQIPRSGRHPVAPLRRELGKRGKPCSIMQFAT